MNKALALALIAAAATGCASTKAKRAANPGVCPNALVLADAARLVEFEGDEAIENVAYTAEIENVELDCRYYEDKPIDANLKIKIAFGRGPKGESREHPFTYFVAVTRTNVEVIEKREYTLPIKFDGDKNVASVEEKIEQIVIPRANETVSGTNFEIVVGLSLTADQVIFNRSGASLKFPDLK
jgi:hypothetical protein